MHIGIEDTVSRGSKFNYHLLLSLFNYFNFAVAKNDSISKNFNPATPLV